MVSVMKTHAPVLVCVLPSKIRRGVLNREYYNVLTSEVKYYSKKKKTSL